MRTLKILIVDDDPEFAEGLALTLEIAGHEVELASTGEAALKTLKRRDFDVTLLDYRMPGMDGVDSYMQIRKFKPDAKVIMMTAHEVPERLDQAIEGGALGVLDKPISESALLDAFSAARLNGDILLVDDDPDFATAIETTLEQAGYSVAIARTGRQAVDIALESEFDVMLLDLRLPLLSGLEVHTQLKEHHRNLATIVITGYAAEEADTIDRLEKMSVTSCLIKPVRSDELLKTIEQLFREARL